MSKKTTKVVLLENIHQNAVAEFERAGYSVEQYKEAFSEAELLDHVQDATILGIRSNTKLTASFFAHMPNLLTVGAFCIGTNQIDSKVASEHGVAVFNAPYSNTRSVVELVIAEIIALSRRLGDKNTQMHNGIWDKSATGCHEVRGRKLGIVGYGNIGSQLSVVAESLGLEVYYFDDTDKLAMSNARKCETLDELLGIVDVVTVHVDGRPSNQGLFGAQQFARMHPGALFLNNSRGSVVDVTALAKSLQSGHLAGAAVDVYPSEPHAKTDTFVTELQGLPNVILTPHVGGSTEEAQANIGEFVSRKLCEFLTAGNTTLSINMPGLTIPQLSAASRLIYTHHNLPGVLAKIDTILAKQGANIETQHLGTHDALGYAVTDVDTVLNATTLESLRILPETIGCRVIERTR
jgi:D-3-phosphoglycerate dehydrogenase